MAAKKYLAWVAGTIKRATAIVVSAGAANDGDLVALDAAGKLDASVMPAGFGQTTIAATASEALAANDLVNLWNDGGTLKVRKADATTVGKEVHGFVTAGVANAATATVYAPGNVMVGLSGLTPGARQYLATVAGTRTEASPSATGNVSQCIGIAAGATSILFEPEEPIEL
jgi:hypothetical protein